MAYNKIYSAHWQQTVASMVSSQPHFRLNSNLQKMRVASITLNLMINEPGANPAVLPLEMNTTQQWYLRIGALLPARSPLYTKTFEHVAGPAPSFNGSQIIFNETGQYIFDSWFISEQIDFQFNYSNLDPVKTYTYNFGILVETIEKLAF